MKRRGRGTAPPSGPSSPPLSGPATIHQRVHRRRRSISSPLQPQTLTLTDKEGLGAAAATTKGSV